MSNRRRIKTARKGECNMLGKLCARCSTDVAREWFRVEGESDWLCDQCWRKRWR